MYKFICLLELCVFVMENNKCCKFFFEFNNCIYIECIVDVIEKKWDDQWWNFWCFLEGGDCSIKYFCYRSGWLSFYFDNFFW